MAVVSVAYSDGKPGFATYLRRVELRSKCGCVIASAELIGLWGSARMHGPWICRAFPGRTSCKTSAFYQNVPFSAYTRNSGLVFSTTARSLDLQSEHECMTSVDTFAGRNTEFGISNLSCDRQINFSSRRCGKFLQVEYGWLAAYTRQDISEQSRWCAALFRGRRNTGWRRMGPSAESDRRMGGETV